MVKIQKTILMIVFLIITFSISQTTYANIETVFDDAALFTELEVEAIREKVHSLTEQLQTDIVIVTTDNNEGKSSKQYADDFYDENGYAYDGILYLINMDDREVYISTSGTVRDIIDWQVEEILEEVYLYLAEEQYSESVYVFLAEYQARMLDSTDFISENDGVAQIPSDIGNNVEVDYYNEGSFINEILIYFSISIVIGGITVGIMAMSNRGRLTVNEGTYLERDSFKITRKVDRHYNTIVTQQKIQRNNTTGGGGSSSSFGGGHGGGGRKF